MALKHIRLGRAERLDEATRKMHNLPDKGLILIQTTNTELEEKIIPIDPNDKNGGIRGYLLSFGNFKEEATV
ncbi:MAG: hypothetical protein KKB25_01350 [Nanoarchaeota archaeon]|nr:hypothetical protein [Nanoarchaeota archaeon]